jgi:hypothetical protein
MQILDLDRKDPLVVSNSEWGGTERIDVRTHYFPKGEDVPKPTKKGVSIKIDEFPAVVQAMLDAYNEVTGASLTLTDAS